MKSFTYAAICEPIKDWYSSAPTGYVYSTTIRGSKKATVSSKLPTKVPNSIIACIKLDLFLAVWLKIIRKFL